LKFVVNFAWQDLRGSGATLWLLCTCVALGVTLVAATGALYRHVSHTLLADTRALLGGDLEVSARSPLPEPALAWMRARGRVSLLHELRTMLGTPNEQFTMVELQSVDQHYPLYGELELDPERPLGAVTGKRGGLWGMAIDPVLAQRLGLAVGQQVSIGSLTLEVRAVITKQPDRSLSAGWRGAPVLVSEQALQASGLIQPASRVDYEYRVRTNIEANEWREQFYQQFAQTDWEVRTFHERSERIGTRLAQVASGLLIIGFSTLFVGGLGVFNSVQTYLQGKLTTLATLRSMGLRNRKLATVYLLQIGILAGGSCLVGALAGLGLALTAAAYTPSAAHISVAPALSHLLPALWLAMGFGLLSAFTFAMPAIGRALAVHPGVLFRGTDARATETPKRWWLASLGGGIVIALLVLVSLPDPLFGLGFIFIVCALLLLLDLVVRILRWLGRSLDDHRALGERFALRMALANLHRPGSAVRSTLLSLGTALTLLVACAIVVSTLIQTIDTTVTRQVPALVLYDISQDQLDDVINVTRHTPGVERFDSAPLVLARLAKVNGEDLRDSNEDARRHEARDEQKVTYRATNIDNVTMVRGGWWDADAKSTPNTQLAHVVMEDREAEQVGLQVGDSLTFSVNGEMLEARLSGIYKQKGLQTRFWFEAIFSDGALDPFIHRYVGAGYMDDTTAKEVQGRIAEIAPNVVSVRTASILETARGLLRKASAGLGAIALISLCVSLLVLTGVMAASRTRQIYEATILHSLGARLSVIRHALMLEYVLLAVITSLFSTVFGTAIAWSLLVYRLKLDSDISFALGFLIAVGVSTLCLFFGASYLLRRLRVRPAVLLRSGG
jgi:putative ABC transport system permease protein